MACSPLPPLAYRDDKVVPVRELSHLGSKSAGKKHSRAFSLFSNFLLKSYYPDIYGIVTTPVMRCDECRRPRRGAPAADQLQNLKKILPAVPRRGPEAEIPPGSAILLFGYELNWFLSFFVRVEKTDVCLSLILIKNLIHNC